MKIKKAKVREQYDDDAPKSKKPKLKLVKTEPAKGKKGKAVKKEKVAAKKTKGSVKKGKAVKKEKKIMQIDVKPIKQKQNKSQLMQHLVEEADIVSLLPKKMQDLVSERHEKKIVVSVMNALERTILAHVVKGGSGNFMFPTMFKVVTKKTPAKPARKGRNPFTGEEMMFKAKPASIKVRMRPMRKLKDAALN